MAASHVEARRPEYALRGRFEPQLVVRLTAADVATFAEPLALSEVPHDALRALAPPNRAIDAWLHETIVPAPDALYRYPSRSLSATVVPYVDRQTARVVTFGALGYRIVFSPETRDQLVALEDVIATASVLRDSLLAGPRVAHYRDRACDGAYRGDEALRDYLAVVDRYQGARNVLIAHSLGSGSTLALLAHLAGVGCLGEANGTVQLDMQFARHVTRPPPLPGGCWKWFKPVVSGELRGIRSRGSSGLLNFDAVCRFRPI
ncbi:hypothetical protein GR157_33580 [Burkholderia sp. 4701]|nr:hypothetical protein [Burkholderia sp. 4701]MXN86916.1 hypothetical protein [Burkholderia sp. 4812]